MPTKGISHILPFVCPPYIPYDRPRPSSPVVLYLTLCALCSPHACLSWSPTELQNLDSVECGSYRKQLDLECRKVKFQKGRWHWYTHCTAGRRHCHCNPIRHTLIALLNASSRPRPYALRVSWDGIQWRADDLIFDFETCPNYQKLS